MRKTAVYRRRFRRPVGGGVLDRPARNDYGVLSALKASATSRNTALRIISTLQGGH